jgi:transcriptional repressor NrdR
MRCPSCGYKGTNVMDSRLNSDGTSIRRRRKCSKCEERFTTYEYIEEVPLMVVKRDGRRQAFDRTRVLNGLIKACEKRPISVSARNTTVKFIPKISGR